MILYTNYTFLFQLRGYTVLLFFPQLSSYEYLMYQLKAELARKCQVCHGQSQEIQKLRTEVKEAELLSMENESLSVRIRTKRNKHRATCIYNRLEKAEF